MGWLPLCGGKIKTLARHIAAGQITNANAVCAALLILDMCKLEPPEGPPAFALVTVNESDDSLKEVSRPFNRFAAAELEFHWFEGYFYCYPWGDLPSFLILWAGTGP